jgi:hypothetical protein
MADRVRHHVRVEGGRSSLAYLFESVGQVRPSDEIAALGWCSVHEQLSSSFVFDQEGGQAMGCPAVLGRCRETVPAEPDRVGEEIADRYSTMSVVQCEPSRHATRDRDPGRVMLGDRHQTFVPEGLGRHA